MLNPEEILIDKGAQIRVNVNQEMVNSYTELLNESNGRWIFPSLACVEIDGKFHLADGHHRLQAAKNAGIEQIPIDIVGTSEKEQFEYACRANQKNGIPLTSADRRKMAKMACITFSDWPLSRIARMTGFSTPSIKIFRDELVQSGELVLPEVVISKDGKARKPQNTMGGRAVDSEKEAEKQMEEITQNFLEENGEDIDEFRLPSLPSAALKFYYLKAVFRVSTDKLKIQAANRKDAMEQIRNLAMTNSVRLDWDLLEVEG